MKLWLENGDSFPLQLSVQDCALDLAMPPARAGKVINELIDTGHIEPDYRFGQRGRPKRFIDISAATTEMLRNLTPTHPGRVLHLESVHRLLACRTSDADADSQSLSPANIVFLIALFSFANECGAVRGLGVKKLSTYTGMTAQRINLQISKLRRLKVLLSAIPGTTSGRILGKTTTVYWLNLDHQFLKPSEHRTVLKPMVVTLASGEIVCGMFELFSKLKVERKKYVERASGRLSRRQATRLALKNLCAPPIKQSAKLDFSLVEGFFGEVSNPGLRFALQSVVDQIACDNALSRIHVKVTKGKVSMTTTELRSLYKELLPLNLQHKKTTTFPTWKNKPMLIRLVLSMASTVADELILLIRQLGIDATRLTSLELAQISREPSTDRYLIVAQDHSEPDKETKIEKLEENSGI
ncbi:hypothetical protein [uncultured Marinobacter sp.]|uniref:hypothetical protein n=1 Tax=uncultured Marinobacter sp. TaxID=187379 RepID=UPI0025DA42AD|nr:hypothetical protein [uncultured Marinobacter sp.]